MSTDTAGTGVDRAPSTAPSTQPSTALSWLYVIAGLIGLGSALTLTVEKFILAENASYVPTCSFSAEFACSSVMSSPQASAFFGVPNPLWGLIGFAVVTAIGVVQLAGFRPPRWFRYSAQVGFTAAMLFCMWLFTQSVYDIGALCLYCMITWAVTVTMFWFTTVENLRIDAPDSAVTGFVHMLRYPILIAWVALIALLICVEFRFLFF